MTPAQLSFLNLRNFPARFSVQETAWYLGYEAAAIPILVARRMLAPLGNPPPNAMKHFHMAELEELRRDKRWFVRAEDALYHHWQSKNARCRDRRRGSPTNETCVRSTPSTRRIVYVDPDDSTQQ